MLDKLGLTNSCAIAVPTMAMETVMKTHAATLVRLQMIV